MRRMPFRALILVSCLALGSGMYSYGRQTGMTRVMGGPGGETFSDFRPQAGARVVEVLVRSGDRVDAVQMIYQLPDGRTVPGPRYGGSGGNLNTFRLESDEYITSLSGRFGQYVDSLRIHTNRRTSRVFGGPGGARNFRVEIPSGNQAVGFAGRAGEYVDAIGLTYVPMQMQRRRGIYAPEGSVQISQTAIAGGGGGSLFADQGIPPGARIAEISIRAGEMIDALQVIYMPPTGRVQEGPRHGGNGGNAYSFRLDADEYIIGIFGRHGDMIDSITFRTNRRVSQRFGGGGGNRDFRIDVPAGSQAVGFAGRAGDRLDAIGLTYRRGGNFRR